MKSTCESFWRMVQENEVSLIIALCPEEEQNKVKLFKLLIKTLNRTCATDITNLPVKTPNLNSEILIWTLCRRKMYLMEWSRERYYRLHLTWKLRLPGKLLIYKNSIGLTTDVLSMVILTLKKELPICFIKLENIDLETPTAQSLYIAGKICLHLIET